MNSRKTPQIFSAHNVPHNLGDTFILNYCSSKIPVSQGSLDFIWQPFTHGTRPLSPLCLSPFHLLSVPPLLKPPGGTRPSQAREFTLLPRVPEILLHCLRQMKREKDRGQKQRQAEDWAGGTCCCALATPAAGTCNTQVWPEASHTSGAPPTKRDPLILCMSSLLSHPPQCSENRHLSL